MEHVRSELRGQHFRGKILVRTSFRLLQIGTVRVACMVLATFASYLRQSDEASGGPEFAVGGKQIFSVAVCTIVRMYWYQLWQGVSVVPIEMTGSGLFLCMAIALPSRLSHRYQMRMCMHGSFLCPIQESYRAPASQCQVGVRTGLDAGHRQLSCRLKCSKTSIEKRYKRLPYHRKCCIHCKYSNTPIPESFRDYLPEIGCHVL
jgi:hypothetical protein